MQGKTVTLAVTNAMVAAAEQAYNTEFGSGSLEWLFTSRMRLALEAALQEVNDAQKPELDEAMLKTLDGVSAHFDTEGQLNVAKMLRLIRHRISAQALQSVPQASGQ